MKFKRNENIIYQCVENGELEIDEKGRIWRIAKKVGCRSILVPVDRRRAERKARNGYLLIHAKFDTHRFGTGAHRVVFRHFFGEIPQKLTINHKNGIKDDNRPQNLELMTVGQQNRHAIDVLGRVNPKGESHGSSKLTESDVFEILNRRKTGETYQAIANDFCVSYHTIYAIISGQSWKHIPRN